MKIAVSIILVLLILIALTGLFFRDKREERIQNIRAEEAYELWLSHDTGIVFLDVRTSGEYHGPLGHIEGSVLIPLQELPARHTELESHRDRQIIVYCRIGHRSVTATEILIRHGYKAVNMPGGMIAWNRLAENQ